MNKTTNEWVKINNATYLKNYELGFDRLKLIAHRKAGQLNYKAELKLKNNPNKQYIFCSWSKRKTLIFMKNYTLNQSTNKNIFNKVLGWFGR